MALFSAASRMNEAAPAGIAACGSDSSGGNKGIFIQRLDGERSEMGLSLPSICSLSSCHSTGVEEAPQSQKTDSEEVMIPGYHCSDRSSSTENCDSTHKKGGEISLGKTTNSSMAFGRISTGKQRFRHTIPGTAIFSEKFMGGRTLMKEKSIAEFDLVERINEYAAEWHLDNATLLKQCGDSSRPAESLLEALSRAVSSRCAGNNTNANGIEALEQ